jgi:UDP:flavonoid glycosyltransferase YjiC (YdhE family)
MNILFVAVGHPGHCFPLVPLAKELLDAGHEVTFATSASIESTIASAGLNPVVVGVDVPTAITEAVNRRPPEPDQSETEYGMYVAGTVFGDIMPRAFAADLQPWIEQHRPDLVIAEIACLGGSLAAAVAEVPCVLHSFGRRLEADAILSEAITTPFAEVVKDFGLPALRQGDLLGQACLDICPPSLQASALGAPTRRVPLRPTPWNSPMPSGPSRPHADRPWVYLTLGTVSDNVDAVRAAAEGLARLDVDILLAAGAVSTTELTGLPDSVQVETFVPQAELLNQFALVVHHGGSGTTMGAATHGIPQLLLPQGADQFANAAALSAFGAGLSLLGAEISADAVESAARTLLAEGTQRQAARDLADEIATLPSVKTVAGDIRSWAPQLPA